MIKKYVLGLLLVCVAFAGWGQIDLELEVNPYSHTIKFENNSHLTNVIMAVEFEDSGVDHKIYFDQNGKEIDISGFHISEFIESIDKQTGSIIFDINSIVKQHPLHKTATYPHSIYHAIQPRFAQQNIMKNDILLTNSDTDEIRLQKVYSSIISKYQGVYGQYAMISIYIYNNYKIRKLIYPSLLEYFPNELELINDLKNDYSLSGNINDCRLELLAQTLSNNNDSIQGNDVKNSTFYNAMKSYFYSSNKKVETSLASKVELNDIPNELRLEIKKYLMHMFSNMIDISHERNFNNSFFPLLKVDSEVSYVIYKNPTSYLRMYFSFLAENNLIPLASDYSRIIRKETLGKSYFDNSSLTEISEQEGRQLADASLLYLALNYKQRYANARFGPNYDIKDILSGIKDWIDHKNSYNGERLFNFSVDEATGHDVDLTIQVTNSRFKYLFDSPHNSIFGTYNKGIPYNNQGIDTPFLYHHKLYNRDQLNDHHALHRLGVDSYGVLLGSISMVESISRNFFAVENKQMGENLNDLNSLNSIGDRLYPLLDNSALNWNIESNQLSRILYDELSLNNADLERSSKIIPDYNQLRPGDLFVQYGTNNLFYNSSSQFEKIINQDDSRDLNPKIGIVVHIEKENVGMGKKLIKRIWILSTNEKDGVALVKPLEIDSVNQTFAVNKYNFLIRRLLKSKNEQAPISNAIPNYDWSILSQSTADFKFNPSIQFTKGILSEKQGIDTYEIQDRYVANNGHKLGFRAINFFVGQDISNEFADVEIISPADPWYTDYINFGSTGIETERNADDYYLEFGYSANHIIGYDEQENGSSKIHSDWLVRFELKDPDELKNAIGLNNYYVHFNPVYYVDNKLKNEYRLYLEKIEGDENFNYKLSFINDTNYETNYFYVSVKDSSDPTDGVVLMDDKIGDDFLLRFFLPAYNVSSDALTEQAARNRIIVYDATQVERIIEYTKSLNGEPDESFWESDQWISFVEFRDCIDKLIELIINMIEPALTNMPDEIKKNTRTRLTCEIEKVDFKAFEFGFDLVFERDNKDWESEKIKVVAKIDFPLVGGGLNGVAKAEIKWGFRQSMTIISWDGTNYLNGILNWDPSILKESFGGFQFAVGGGFEIFGQGVKLHARKYLFHIFKIPDLESLFTKEEGAKFWIDFLTKDLWVGIDVKVGPIKIQERLNLTQLIEDLLK